jgi:very-short-patch-repair endonuclease
VDPALARLALEQNGVFHLCQIVSAGLSASGVRARARRHRLHRIHDGVYALVPEPLLTPNGRRMAAVLACGSGAALSHHSSLKLRGLRDSNRSKIDVTVPTRGGRSRSGIAVHRSNTLRPQDVELVQGIPCTTLARTIFDMAGVLTPRDLERLLDELAYQELLDAAALIEQIEHNRGRVGACANLRRALAEHHAGSTLTDGPLGEEMLALIRSAELPAPKVQHWIDLGDGEPMIQADFAWPEAKVILETDGQQAHGKPRRTQADYRRDQRAARAGWHTLRVTRRQVRAEPERIIETVATLIRTRLAPRAEPRTRRRRAGVPAERG